MRMVTPVLPAVYEAAGNKYDGEKLRYNLLPMDAVDEVVRRFTHGAQKYAPDNWKRVENPVERYATALMRHYSAWRQGEVVDGESGLTHIGAVAWNALVLVWFDLHKEEKV
jgi:hypothetical protein